jgi:hypothetical protein
MQMPHVVVGFDEAKMQSCKNEGIAAVPVPGGSQFIAG